MKKSVIVLILVAFFVAACSVGQHVYDSLLGPADTDPQRAYRLISAEGVIIKRISTDQVGAAVKAGVARAELSAKTVYAAVSASNQPAALPLLISAAVRDLFFVMAEAKIIDLVGSAPNLTDPVSVSMFALEELITATQLIPLYKNEIAVLRAELSNMVVTQTDPTQEQWDTRWTVLEKAFSEIAAK